MRIGELAEATDTPATTLRYYEGAGRLLPSGRTASGYRVYHQSATDRLGFISRAQHAGLTLSEIRGVLDLRDNGEPPCQQVRDLLDARLTALDRQLTELHALRREVAELRSHAADLDPAHCPPEQVCRYL